MLQVKVNVDGELMREIIFATIILDLEDRVMKELLVNILLQNLTLTS